MRVAKRLLRQSDPLAAVMAYRSTPLETTGYSPSQLLMGRNIRTKLITLPHNLTPHWPDQTVVRVNDERMKRRTAESYNRRKGARPLPPLTEGDLVRIRLPNDKQWSDPERVLARRGDSSYLVRNRRHLQCVPEINPEDTAHNNNESNERKPEAPPHKHQALSLLKMLMKRMDVI